ncbi:hypothetical protein [Pseudomonas frederiksbergensis]|uniref:hypothetical protein n=1 Tax=Pseudomonas frederiksbergensis TaxID=104087 RepID=UPI0012EB318F|nr:hypothetical protein [Pseudomonas frederiksbergensis]
MAKLSRRPPYQRLDRNGVPAGDTTTISGEFSYSEKKQCANRRNGKIAGIGLRLCGPPMIFDFGVGANTQASLRCAGTNSASVLIKTQIKPGSIFERCTTYLDHSSSIRLSTSCYPVNVVGYFSQRCEKTAIFCIEPNHWRFDFLSGLTRDFLLP